MEDPTVQPQSWFVMSRTRTLFALVFLALLVALIPVINSSASVDFGVPRWAARVGSYLVLLLVFFGLRSIFQGGCIVDTHARQLIRWWGLLVPFWRREIPFTSIRNIHLSYGLYPHGIRAARKRDEWFNLAAEIDGGYLLLRRERSRDRADEFGRMLVSLLQCKLLDCTVTPHSE